MLNGNLFSVRFSTGLAWRNHAERNARPPTSLERSAVQQQATPTDSETQPCLARGKLSPEHCAANARHNDTAPETGLLLSSDIETE